jgi:hypothetical protein
MKTNIITPYIIDTTLRDGEQAPGVVFSPSEKLHIAQLLDKLGIEEIEAGSPFVHESEIKTIKSIVNSGFKYRISCWSRARFDDIDTALKTGAEGINISFPVSDIQLSAIGKNRKWVFELLPEIIGGCVTGAAGRRISSLSEKSLARNGRTASGSPSTQAAETGLKNPRCGFFFWPVGFLWKLFVKKISKKIASHVLPAGSRPAADEFHKGSKKRGEVC